MQGTAGSAALITRGITGCDASAASMDTLHLNFTNNTHPVNINGSNNEKAVIAGNGQITVGGNIVYHAGNVNNQTANWNANISKAKKFMFMHPTSANQERGYLAYEATTGANNGWAVHLNLAAIGTGYRNVHITNCEEFKVNSKNVSIEGHTHSDYLPLTGGTMTGALTFKNNTWNPVGDDVLIGDCNVAGSLGIKSASTNADPGLVFYNKAGTNVGNMRLSADLVRFTNKTMTLNDRSVLLDGDKTTTLLILNETGTTGTWTAIATNIDELKDGMLFTVYQSCVPNGDATLNLTLKDGSITVAILCYYNSTTRL